MKEILSILLIVYPGLIYAQSNFIGSGISVNFSGSTTDYVDLGDAFNSLTFPFTFEAWINQDASPPDWGGVMGTDNDVVNYNGFWIRTHFDNTLEIEFGNGFGSGIQFRRGYVTANSFYNDEWTHIAIVCTSVTDVNFYFNGVPQLKVPSDGGSSSTAFTHSASGGSFGGTFNAFGDEMFTGQMDEIRLWDVVRTTSDIRENMCKKIDPATPGLIGYWTADESYTSNDLQDLTAPSENGTLAGSVTKATSGAPIGDASAYVYSPSWNGLNISIPEACGDSIIANNITGSPKGIHVYLVDSLPHDTLGLGMVPQFYFGVFCARSANVPHYDVSYHYDFDDGAINSVNEPTAKLFRRDDGSVTMWSDAGAVLNTGGDSLFKNNESRRGEYILDVHNTTNVAFAATETQLCEKFCIDFFDQSINNPTSWYWIFEGGVPNTSTVQNPAQVCYQFPGTYDVTLITTNISGNDTLILNNFITVFPTPPIPTIIQDGNVLTCSGADSYQWQFNAVNIPGATNQSYIVTQDGLYTVVIGDQNGCVNSQSIEYTGTDDVSNERDILIFPNPVIDNLTITIPSLNLTGDIEISLRDISGRIAVQYTARPANSFLINLSLLPAGVYILNLKSDNYIRYFEIMVK